MLADHGGGAGGDDALLALSLGQRTLDLDQVGNILALGEALADLFGAEDVPEELGVEDGGR